MHTYTWMFQAQLQILLLNDNQLIGTIPSELGNAKNVRGLAPVCVCPRKGEKLRDKSARARTHVRFNSFVHVHDLTHYSLHLQPLVFT